MHVLVITWNYPPRRGGIENVLDNLCRGLRNGRRVYVITSCANLACSAEPDTFRAPFPGLICFAAYAIWRGALILTRERQIHAIFGGSALVTPLVLILARLFRRRGIMLIHGLDVIHRNSLYQLLCVRWLKFCDHVSANSNYTASLARSKGVVDHQLTVIPPGVHPERFSIPVDVVATKQRWSITATRTILFVGRLAKRKGIREFIQNAVLKIVREIPEAVLLIVGDNPSESLAHHDDDIAAEIKTTVSAMGLETHVRLLGSLGDEDLIQLYQACDVVVLPGLESEADVEGFGIVAIEAAAAGKSVVATRVGGVPDAIEDGKTGQLVEPGDYGGLSGKVVELLKNDRKRQALEVYARLRATRDFNWTHIVRSYEKILLVSTEDQSIR